jgi:hypothetical protein
MTSIFYFSVISRFKISKMIYSGKNGTINSSTSDSIDSSLLAKGQSTKQYQMQTLLTPKECSSHRIESIPKQMHWEELPTPMSDISVQKRLSRKSKPYKSESPNETLAAPGYIIKIGFGSEDSCIVRCVNYEPLPEELRPFSDLAYCNIFKKSEIKYIKRKRPRCPEPLKRLKVESSNTRSRRLRVATDEIDGMEATDSSIDLIE